MIQSNRPTYASQCLKYFSLSNFLKHSKDSLNSITWAVNWHPQNEGTMHTNVDMTWWNDIKKTTKRCVIIRNNAVDFSMTKWIKSICIVYAILTHNIVHISFVLIIFHWSVCCFLFAYNLKSFCRHEILFN